MRSMFDRPEPYIPGTAGIKPLQALSGRIAITPSVRARTSGGAKQLATAS